MRKTNGTKAAGVSFEHLHVNKRQASSEYGHDYLELGHTRGHRSQNDSEMASHEEDVN